MGNLFKNRSRIVLASWLVILVYAASSIYLLAMAATWENNSSYSQTRSGLLVVYAITSFLLAALVSVYHISSLLRRRRRSTDRQRMSRARFVRAKHRRQRPHGRKR